jgi:hypothetical protein
MTPAPGVCGRPRIVTLSVFEFKVTLPAGAKEFSAFASAVTGFQFAG